MKSLNFIAIPNLPVRRVKYLLTDFRTAPVAVDALEKLGVRCLLTTRAPSLQEPVCGHADMGLHHLGGRKFCCPLETAFYYAKILPGADILTGNSILQRNYPDDIAYNVGRVGNNAFHNLKYTDGKIYEYYRKIGVNLIHVRQGYSKCAICVVGPNAIMTADVKIAARAVKHGIDALLIQTGGVCLPGMSSGFIGGAAGLIDRHTLVINGDIRRHPDCAAMIRFCRKYDVEIHSLHSGAIEDIGSFIPLSE